MSNIINTVAFDLGGVLTYQDFSLLTEEELFYFKVYMNRQNIQDKTLVEEARRRILDIYIKVHKLKSESKVTLKLLKDMKVKASIWTNNIHELDAWLEEVGLYSLIDRRYVVNSIYLGYDKPQLEFYRKALSILGDKPSEVLFLDDNISNVRGAQKCGIISKEYNENDSLREVVESGIRRR